MIGATVVIACAVVAQEPPVEDEREHAFRFAAVPTLTFNTDEGFGTGGVGTLYHDYGDATPYRDAFTFNVFLSSKLVQHHAITWDAVKPFDFPARLYLRAGYYSTVSQNYCGVGNEVTCAERAPEFPQLGDDGNAEVARHYHLMRFVRPYATVIARPWLRDKPYRTELLLGWRGSYTIPGQVRVGGPRTLWFESGPYPASRYERDFPVGEPGFSSVPTLGVVVDNRDREVFPMDGFIAEASVRGAHPWIGASWTYAGANAQAAVFLKMAKRPRVVLAQRVIGDVIVGEPSIEEMARIGGTLDSIAFGGAYLGRGIREHRYLGKLKVISQTELRAQLYDHELLDQKLSHGVALFSDVAWIGYDVFDFRGNPTKLLGTAGASYRLIWNDSFAIRWDLATSPNEADGPGFYIIVGQTF
jgi:hypothetical protein